MKKDKEEPQTQPCPGCGEYVPETAKNNGHPEDGKRYAVACPHCRLPIVHVVPFHIMAALPHGWKWVRADDRSVFRNELPGVWPKENA